MPEKKQQKPHVTVMINGEKHSLDEWTRTETAADKDTSLDWHGAFSSHEHTLQSEQSRTFSDRDHDPLSRHKPTLFKKKKGWKTNQNQHMRPLRMIRMFWLPGTAAIVVGLVIGLSMLMILSEQNNMIKGSRLGKSSVNTTEEAQTVQRRNLNLSVYMIQAGVFESRSTATQMATKLKEQGSAAVMPTSEGTAIFVGISKTATGSEPLLMHNKQLGMTVFKKQIAIKPTSLFQGDDRRATVAYYGNKLIMTMLDLSDQVELGKKSPSSRTIKTMEKWYTICKQKGSSVKDPETNRFLTDLSLAREAAKTVSFGYTDDHFAHYQQTLLESVIEYNRFIQTGKK
ncbi:hypothetical protein ACFP7A_00980 [Sporolactobacillus kofuensis]|uniref:SPOR domain-containing protein n=1 Tax=Sporolactobacillus kofuensis TaxID=269672 RepID=A0ABW1WDF7_9BACL|nr:hypothetical protein [Sporolactobacillus kofuensis]MCO7175525.1 hypothetical protein [Sporolactobacillus kofuensis]